MTLPHYDILIATPGHSMSAGYVKSLMATVKELNALGITYEFLTGYSSLVHNAREITMGNDTQLNPDDTGPLHNGCTYNKMIWIDSDIEWSVSDFLVIYYSTHDIISGAYLLANGTDSCVVTKEGVTLTKVHIQRGGLTEPFVVQSVGFGFIAIKCGVFERIPRPWFGLLQQEVYNSRGEQLYISIGEDISWTIKAQQLGYEVYFDPKVLVTHLKTVQVTWT
jgi:hypothetical protein